MSLIRDYTHRFWHNFEHLVFCHAETYLLTAVNSYAINSCKINICAFLMFGCSPIHSDERNNETSYCEGDCPN